MTKVCKHCEIILTPEIRAGKRLVCRPCRSKEAMAWAIKNKERRKKTTNAWARRVGRVKEHPCGICAKPCFKKYAKAFCSDKCRFLSHVEVTKGCWLWTGGRNRRGYGKTSINGNSNVTAHRVAYELFKTPVPEGMCVLHACDIPSCVCPAHLFLGTVQDNKQDQIIKGRVGKKLKEADVLEIRKLYGEGMGSQTIAYLYNVTCSTISSIAVRRVWKHI